MNPLLAIGQILVSIALIVAILLQARGAGLSGTFGGDSAVYRSRRGVERRLWQFTIVLLVLFVVFSLASFVFAPPPPPPDRGLAAAHRDANRSRSELDDPYRLVRRRDPRRAVRDHRGPRRRPVAASRRRPPPPRRSAEPGAVDAARAVSRGRPRPPGLGQPADGADAGRSRPRRAGLLRARPQRPGRDARAGPRRALDGRRDRRRLDLPAPRRRALARRRAGHRGGRRVHDPGRSRIPATRARPPAPGTRSPSQASAPRTVDVHARDAARRLPPGRDPADRPGPPARRACRSTQLPTTRSAASRSGPVRSPSPASTDDTRRARSRPRPCCPTPGPSPGPSPRATDSLATPPPAGRPTRPDAVPGRDRVPLLRRPGGARRRLPRRAASTPRPGCRRRWPRELGDGHGQPRRCATRARR